MNKRSPRRVAGPVKTPTGCLVLLLALAGCKSSSERMAEELTQMVWARGDERLLELSRVVVVAGPPQDPGQAAAVASWISATPDHETRSAEAARAYAGMLATRGVTDLLRLPENRRWARPIEVTRLLSWSEAGSAASVASETGAQAIVSIALGRSDGEGGFLVELRRACWIDEPDGTASRRTLNTASRAATFPSGEVALEPEQREAMADAFRELAEEARELGLAEADPLLASLQAAMEGATRPGGLSPAEREGIVAGMLFDVTLPPRAE